MKIHILGICGTFMGGLARILIESGHKVTGSDNNFYPPMSDQLRELDVELTKGFEPSSMPEADLYVIGNALSRGNKCVEEILNKEDDLETKGESKQDTSQKKKETSKLFFFRMLTADKSRNHRGL